jgi:hypothetical protein
MTFWGQPNMKEPLRQNRWFLLFTDENQKELRVALKDCKKPKHSTDVSEYKLVNHYFKYPGLVRWDPVDIKFVSMRGSTEVSDTAYIFYEMLQDSGYYDPDGPNFNNINKEDSLLEAGSAFEIIQLDSNGVAVETWELHNAFISSVDYGNLSYGSDDFVEVSVTLQYDWASLITSNSPEPTASSGQINANITGSYSDIIALTTASITPSMKDPYRQLIQQYDYLTKDFISAYTASSNDLRATRKLDKIRTKKIDGDPYNEVVRVRKSRVDAAAEKIKKTQEFIKALEAGGDKETAKLYRKDLEKLEAQKKIEDKYYNAVSPDIEADVPYSIEEQEKAQIAENQLQQLAKETAFNNSRNPDGTAKQIVQDPADVYTPNNTSTLDLRKADVEKERKEYQDLDIEAATKALEEKKRQEEMAAALDRAADPNYKDPRQKEAEAARGDLYYKTPADERPRVPPEESGGPVTPETLEIKGEKVNPATGKQLDSATTVTSASPEPTNDSPTTSGLDSASKDLDKREELRAKVKQGTKLTDEESEDLSRLNRQYTTDDATARKIANRDAANPD